MTEDIMTHHSSPCPRADRTLSLRCGRITTCHHLGGSADRNNQAVFDSGGRGRVRREARGPGAVRVPPSPTPPTTTCWGSSPRLRRPSCRRHTVNCEVLRFGQQLSRPPPYKFSVTAVDSSPAKFLRSDPRFSFMANPHLWLLYRY